MRRVLALGFFDGVHLGHQELLNMAVRRAEELEATPAAISFDTHPDVFVFNKDVPLINSVLGRRVLINRMSGIEDVIMIHFDEHFMKTTWQDFLFSLVSELGAIHLVIGYDFCCGYKGEGTAEKISDWCRNNKLGCDIINKVEIEGITVSSTYVRSLIADGNVEIAAKFLNHPHILMDTVGSGYKIGRQIGTPTINTRIPKGVIIPRFGVYATKVILPDGERISVTNIGIRPTFGVDDQVTVESYILDFEGDLYGAQVCLEFYSFLRPEVKFASPLLLKKQIDEDIEATRHYFCNK